MRYVDENILSFFEHSQNTMDQNRTEIPAFVITITYIYSLFLIFMVILHPKIYISIKVYHH